MGRDRQTEMPRDWDIVARWMLPGLALLVLLTLIDTVAYHMNEQAQQAHALADALPRDHDQTVRALVIASGHSCEDVCSLTPVGTFSDRLTLITRCGVKTASGTCDHATSYTLTIAPSTQPSR